MPWLEDALGAPAGPDEYRPSCPRKKQFLREQT